MLFPNPSNDKFHVLFWEGLLGGQYFDYEYETSVYTYTIMSFSVSRSV